MIGVVRTIFLRTVTIFIGIAFVSCGPREQSSGMTAIEIQIPPIPTDDPAVVLPGVPPQGNVASAHFLVEGHGAPSWKPLPATTGDLPLEVVPTSAPSQTAYCLALESLHQRVRMDIPEDGLVYLSAERWREIRHTPWIDGKLVSVHGKRVSAHVAIEWDDTTMFLLPLYTWAGTSLSAMDLRHVTANVPRVHPGMQEMELLHTLGLPTNPALWMTRSSAWTEGRLTIHVHEDTALVIDIDHRGRVKAVPTLMTFHAFPGL